MKTDSELVRQLQDGSLEALGDLYDRHQRLVYRTALAITGDAEAAADLLQDVFLRLHRFSDHIDPNRPIEPWLYRMTANQSYTWMKRSRFWLSLIEEKIEWIAGAAKNIVVHQTFNDENQNVKQALAALPLQQRIVVVLYYLNDLSLQEISEVLDIPVGTVKSRLHYGREKMRTNLAQSENERMAELKCEFT
jgi:RNA polymerase sigma-70 factor, ECF subfamily